MDKITYKNGKRSKDIFFSILICEIIILLPKLYIIANTIPFTDIKDEVAMLSVPAYLAGCHWDNIMENASYYGFGFFIFFMPLFRLNISIVLKYKIILLVTAIVEGVIPIILFNLLIEHFEVYSKSNLILISILNSFITINPLYNLTNEHILIILCWLIVFLLVKLVYVKTIKQKNIYSILLSIVMIYGLFIHTRFIALIFSVILGVILFKFVYKEWVVSKFFFIIFSIGYFGANLTIKQIQHLVWGEGDLLNASVGISIPRGNNILSTIVGGMKVLLGNIGTMQFFYFSCIFVILFSLLDFIYINFKNKKNTHMSKVFFLISVIFILCTGATLFAIMIQHGRVFSKPIENKNISSIKYLTYLRYYILYTSPLFFLWCILLTNKKFVIKKIYKVAFLIDILIVCAWVTCVAPDVSETYFGTSTFYPFSYLLGMKNKLTYTNLTGITIVVLDISILLLLIYKKYKNANVIFVILASLFIYRYIYFSINIAIPVAKANYDSVDMSVQYVKGLNGSVNNIYVYSDAETLPFLYQAYLYRSEIMVGIPANPQSGDILLSNESISDLINEWEWMSVNLNNNEWIYIKLDN